MQLGCGDEEERHGPVSGESDTVCASLGLSYQLPAQLNSGDQAG